MQEKKNPPKNGKKKLWEREREREREITFLSGQAMYRGRVILR